MFFHFIDHHLYRAQELTFKMSLFYYKNRQHTYVLNNASTQPSSCALGKESSIFNIVNAIATLRYHGGIEHIPVVISLSTRVDSLMFKVSTIFSIIRLTVDSFAAYAFTLLHFPNVYPVANKHVG